MTVSNKYLTIDSETWSATIERALAFQGLEYTKKVSKGAGSKYLYIYTITNLGDYCLAGDVVYPRIMHFNSYNGECAAFTTAGFLRAACNNGMVLGNGFFGNRIIHRQGVTAETKLKQLEYQIAATAQYIKNELPTIINELASKEVLEEEMIEIVGSLPISNTNKNWAINKIVNKDYRRAADQYNDLWILWNIVNESMAQNYRSSVRFFERNLNLIDDIMFLYEDIVNRKASLIEEVA